MPAPFSGNFKPGNRGPKPYPIGSHLYLSLGYKFVIAFKVTLYFLYLE